MKLWSLIILLVCAVSSEYVQAETRILDGGAAKCEVVVPADGGGVTVQRAAAEVAKYLKRMSGADVGIAGEGAATLSIALHIGPTTVAQRYIPPGSDAALRSVLSCSPFGKVLSYAEAATEEHCTERTIFSKQWGVVG